MVSCARHTAPLLLSAAVAMKSSFLYTAGIKRFAETSGLVDVLLYRNTLWHKTIIWIGTDQFLFTYVKYATECIRARHGLSRVLAAIKWCCRIFTATPCVLNMAYNLIFSTQKKSGDSVMVPGGIITLYNKHPIQGKTNTKTSIREMWPP